MIKACIFSYFLFISAVACSIYSAVFASLFLVLTVYWLALRLLLVPADDRTFSIWEELLTDDTFNFFCCFAGAGLNVTPVLFCFRDLVEPLSLFSLFLELLNV